MRTVSRRRGFRGVAASGCVLAATFVLGCPASAPPPQTVVVVVPTSTSTAAEVVPTEEPKVLDCPGQMAFLAGGELTVANDKRRQVADFCLDVTEVTVSAYTMCVERGACTADDLECDDAWTYNRAELADHPINCVSWVQADRFCHSLGKRLPTWEEWEWAAQGRTERRRFPWGDTEPVPDQMCWSLGAQHATTCPVGSYPTSRSAQGIDDLLGNLWEWLAPQVRRGVPNVARGGAWQNADLTMLEGENAGSFVPGFVRNDVVGFRCAYDGGRSRSPDPPPDDAPVARSSAAAP